MNTLHKTFHSELAPKLQESLSVKNKMRVPKLSKIVINMGVKDAVADKKNVEKAESILAQIAGQKPKVTKAKKSIATFKLRQGQEIGLMVTLRGDRMYEFFEKLTKVVLPRLRDFHGVKKSSFDGKGNYALGLSEFTVFPEIDVSKIDRIQGLEICIVTTANDNLQGLALLEILGMPFMKESNK